MVRIMARARVRHSGLEQRSRVPFVGDYDRPIVVRIMARARVRHSGLE